MSVSGHVKLIKRKRGDQWYAKYRLPSGKQVQKRLGPAWTERSRTPAGYFTRKTAQAELEEILVAARRGEIPDPGDSAGKTFGDAVAEWLRYSDEDNACKSSTLHDYGYAAKSCLLPAFGKDTPLDRITDDRVNGYRSRLLADGKVSRRTAQKLLGFMHSIFKRARFLKWVRVNPVEAVEPVKLRPQTEFNYLDVSQVEAIASKAPGMYSAAIIVAAYTGLRAGELRALRWRDVDFAGATIRVQRNKPTGGEEDSPKSGKGRSVPLMDDAARALDTLSRRQHFTGPDDRVFATETGEMLGDKHFRCALYDAMESAGIDRESFPARDGFTFHDLRHTFGTLAVQVFPLVDVQAYMGHAHIQTTMRYAHHVPKHDAAQRFTRAVEQWRGAEAVSQTVSRTAENSAQLSAAAGTEYVPR
jgi:integrase